MCENEGRMTENMSPELIVMTRTNRQRIASGRASETCSSRFSGSRTGGGTSSRRTAYSANASRARQIPSARNGETYSAQRLTGIMISAEYASVFATEKSLSPGGV